MHVPCPECMHAFMTAQKCQDAIPRHTHMHNRTRTYLRTPEELRMLVLSMATLPLNAHERERSESPSNPRSKV